MYFIFWYDYVLLPFYAVAAILFLNNYFKRRHGVNPELKEHFVRGMLFKLLGCVAIGMIYELYYQGAYDGRFYFEGAKLVSSYLKSHPGEFFNLMGATVEEFDRNNLEGLNLNSLSIYADSSFSVAKVAGIFNLFAFEAFLPCSIFFFVFSYIAIWRLFMFFVENYKMTYRIAGFCTIYIPSVMVWGSSIFKDTICFAALCWLFICGHYLFIRPKNVLVNALGVAASIIAISQVKVYILGAYLPFYILYIFNSYKYRIKNPLIKTLVTPLVFVASVSIVFFLLQNSDELLGNYSLNQVLETASRTYGYISESSAGSAYTLNVNLTTPAGILVAIPAGVNITLFRPYPWEYLKPFTLFASLESMAILYFTIRVIFRTGIPHLIKSLWRDPLIQFAFLFSILFAFLVGVSSANFGSLVRYKIPILPFYCLFLVRVYQLRFPQDPTVSRNTEFSTDT